MAITLYGVDPSIDEAHWAQLHDLATDQVVSGLTPTVGTGTRLVNVGTGNAYAAGVLATSTAVTAVTLAANTSGQSRIDYVVLNIDWTGTQTTGGTVTSVTGTPGSSPVAPNLIQTAGTRWQIPLARVSVPNGATQLGNNSVEDARPGRQRPVVYKSDITGVSIGPSANPRTVATIVVPDPGWRYKLEISGAVEFDTSSVGHGVMNALVDGNEIDQARAGNGNASTAVLSPVWTGNRSGTSTVVTFTVNAFNMTQNLVAQPSNSRMTVVVHPAQ